MNPADAQLKGTRYCSLLGKEVRSRVTGVSERCKHLKCGCANLIAEEVLCCSLEQFRSCLELLWAPAAIAGLSEEKA